MATNNTDAGQRVQPWLAQVSAAQPIAVRRPPHGIRRGLVAMEGIGALMQRTWALNALGGAWTRSAARPMCRHDG